MAGDYMTVDNLEEMPPEALLEVARKAGVVLVDNPPLDIVRMRLQRLAV